MTGPVDAEPVTPARRRGRLEAAADVLTVAAAMALVVDVVAAVRARRRLVRAQVDAMAGLRVLVVGNGQAPVDVVDVVDTPAPSSEG